MVWNTLNIHIEIPTNQRDDIFLYMFMRNVIRCSARRNVRHRAALEYSYTNGDHIFVAWRHKPRIFSAFSMRMLAAQQDSRNVCRRSVFVVVVVYDLKFTIQFIASPLAASCFVAVRE